MTESQHSFDSAHYRRVAAEIASPVAVVSAKLGNRDYAATVSSFIDISYDPPTMLVSLFDEGRICEAVEQTGFFTISVLTASQERVASWLASPGNPVEGLLTTVQTIRGANGIVRIKDALAIFELQVKQGIPAATHMLFVGEVMHAETGAHFAEMDRPLIHFSREFRTLGR